MPERSASKAVVVASPRREQPATTLSPPKDKARAAATEKATGKKPSAVLPGFRVAVKSSHPSPRPFNASDLTFE